MPFSDDGVPTLPALSGDLFIMPYFSDGGLLEFLPRCVSLRELSLEGCAYITSGGFQRAVMQLKTLVSCGCFFVCIC